MKRLTYRDANGEAWYSDAGTERDRLHRLTAIEDILGDEYDLDRLSVLCNQRMTMRDELSQRFSLTAKIPLDRLRELAEADREGRCVVLPRLEPWQATHPENRGRRACRAKSCSVRTVTTLNIPTAMASAGADISAL